jgi:hypothetical protein
MMLTIIGLEDHKTLRAVGGMDGDEKHIVDKMRSLVMSKSQVVRRTRSYELPLEDEEESIVEIFENDLSGLDLSEVVEVPVFTVELSRKPIDTGWRYQRYPDSDCMLEQFTPSLEAEEDGDWDEDMAQDAERVVDDDFELLEGELTNAMYAPQVGDVRRLTDALIQCGVFELIADSSQDS